MMSLWALQNCYCRLRDQVAQLASSIGEPSALATATEQVTLVRRSQVAIEAEANINANASDFPLTFGAAGLDEIGVSFNNGNIVVPIDGCEIEYSLQLDSQAQRTNFKVLLLDSGGNIIAERHGNAYARNAGNHDETALHDKFYVDAGEYRLATIREAVAGDVDLDDDSYIVLRCYEQKTITYVTGYQ